MLVLFALSALVFFIVAALAYDTGMMLVERRDQQNAADAAALAGARYVLTSRTQAEAAARQIAQTNGFDDSDPNQIVEVHIPAIHGKYAGMPGFIEVDIQSTRPSIFATVIGRSTWPVGASAVATNGQNLTFPFSMLALNPTACKAIAVSGGGVVEAYANIQSNSNGTGCTTGDPVGFSRTGGSTINVYATDATCRVVGELQDQGSGSITCAVAENSFALPDPLRNLPAPAKPSLPTPAMQPINQSPVKPVPDYCPGATPASKAPTETMSQHCDVGGNGSSYNNLKWLLSPGLYPGGIAVTNGATAYLLPGLYWLGGGGLSISGGGSVISVASAADAIAGTWGGGVLIYNSKLPAIPGGSIDMNSNAATMELKPLSVPPTDPNAIYNKVVIFQDRTVTTSITLNGSASTTMVNGIIYVPGGQIKLNGNGGTLVVDQVIADTYDINGNGGTIKIMHGAGVDSHIIAAGLVE